MKKYSIRRLTLYSALVLFTSCRKTAHKREIAPVRDQPALEECLFKTAKKRVLICSSSGGGGHTAAAQAIKEYLHPRYEVAIVNIIEEVLYPIDPVRMVTGERYTGENLYNFFLQGNYCWLTNQLCAIGQWSARFKAGQIEPLLEDFLDQHRPDILISVMPIVNGSLLASAERKDIPFAVFALDHDMACIGFLNGIKSPNYKKFTFSMPFPEEELRQVALATGMQEHQVRCLGVPVRTSFLLPKNKAVIRQEWAIPENKSVVMVLMGSVGSKITARYARELAKMAKPMHLLLCIGKNELLRTDINSITFPEHITVSVIGFTDKIADLMAVSDVLITKAGGLTSYEALVSGIPVIFDRTKNVLAWEKQTIEFVVKKGFGGSLRRMKKLPQLLNQFLDPVYNAQVRERIAAYPLADVKTEIVTLIDAMAAMGPRLPEVLEQDSVSPDAIALGIK